VNLASAWFWLFKDLQHTSAARYFAFQILIRLLLVVGTYFFVRAAWVWSNTGLVERRSVMLSLLAFSPIGVASAIEYLLRPSAMEQGLSFVLANPLNTAKQMLMLITACPLILGAYELRRHSIDNLSLEEITRIVGRPVAGAFSFLGLLFLVEFALRSGLGMGLVSGALQVGAGFSLIAVSTAMFLYLRSRNLVALGVAAAGFCLLRGGYLLESIPWMWRFLIRRPGAESVLFLLDLGLRLALGLVLTVISLVLLTGIVLELVGPGVLPQTAVATAPRKDQGLKQL